MKVIAARKEIKPALFSRRCGLRAVLPWAAVHAACFGEYSEMDKTFQDLVLPVNSRGLGGGGGRGGRIYFCKNLNFKFRQFQI